MGKKITPLIVVWYFDLILVLWCFHLWLYRKGSRGISLKAPHQWAFCGLSVEREATNLFTARYERTRTL